MSVENKEPFFSFSYEVPSPTFYTDYNPSFLSNGQFFNPFSKSEIITERECREKEFNHANLLSNKMTCVNIKNTELNNNVRSEDTQYFQPQSDLQQESFTMPALQSPEDTQCLQSQQNLQLDSFTMPALQIRRDNLGWSENNLNNFVDHSYHDCANRSEVKNEPDLCLSNSYNNENENSVEYQNLLTNKESNDHLNIANSYDLSSCFEKNPEENIYDFNNANSKEMNLRGPFENEQNIIGSTPSPIFSPSLIDTCTIFSSSPDIVTPETTNPTTSPLPLCSNLVTDPYTQGKIFPIQTPNEITSNMHRVSQKLDDFEVSVYESLSFNDKLNTHIGEDYSENIFKQSNFKNNSILNLECSGDLAQSADAQFPNNSKTYESENANQSQQEMPKSNNYSRIEKSNVQKLKSIFDKHEVITHNANIENNTGINEYEMSKFENKKFDGSTNENFFENDVQPSRSEVKNDSTTAKINDEINLSDLVFFPTSPMVTKHNSSVSLSGFQEDWTQQLNSDSNQSTSNAEIGNILDNENLTRQNNYLLSNENITSNPPNPPPRSASLFKCLPPPVPPPPVEDDFKPEPPLRQYVLVPITPGLRSPKILTPPPIHIFNEYSLPPITSVNDLETNSNLLNNSNSTINMSYLNASLKKSTSTLKLHSRELTPVQEEHNIPKEEYSHGLENENMAWAENGKEEMHDSLHNYISDYPCKINTQCIPHFENLTKRTETQSSLPVTTILPSVSKSSDFTDKNPDSGVLSNNIYLSTSKVTDSEKSNSLFTDHLNGAEISIYSTGENRSTDMSRDSMNSLPPPPPLINCSSTSVLKRSSYGKLVINRSDLPLPSPDEEIRKVFANIKHWGWIIENQDTLAIYTQLRPLIQEGPQCGLAALSMVSQVFPQTLLIDDLLREARKRGCSRHGEMFSAQAMSDLANGMLKGVEASVKEDLLNSPRNVVQILMEGDFVLFPYDTEPNHQPGFRQGQKSHWAIMCGCLIQSNSFKPKPESTTFKQDLRTDYLWHYRPFVKTVNQKKFSRSLSMPLTSMFSGEANIDHRVSRSVSPRYNRNNLNSDTNIVSPKKDNNHQETSDFESDDPDYWSSDISNILILYRQGKSRNLMCAPLEDICSSNNQLRNYTTDEDFVIDSVEEGLCGKTVFLHKDKPGLSDFLGVLQSENEV